ncbi:hypothetical protein WR25_02878 [Diploscapter pachys]|uniref:Exportin-4 n=1 Tax=Diploscapter pachys TaxID=2018661 RepID=A0A2A2LEU2_9BILA|nr:hypothetical protein WR25_02878 [Diploscapter pachys]
MRAKREFEKSGLRKLLEMTLTTLHHIATQDANFLQDEFHRRVVDKFLEVAENIFQWSFINKISLNSRFLLNSSQSATFRPPESWSDIIRNPEFLPLFFNMHSLVRADENLCARSMTCLVQLSALSGDTVPGGGSPNIAQEYVNIFIARFLQLFSGGPLPHEINGLCSIINRMVLFRPVQFLIRLEPELRNQFFMFLAEYTKHLTKEAIRKDFVDSEHDDHISLALIYDSYLTLLRGRWRSSAVNPEEADMIDQHLLATPAQEIVSTFVTSLLAPPLGERPHVDASNETEDDSDDRTLFADLLNPLSTMACYNVGDFMTSMISTLRTQLGGFRAMAAGSADASRLPLFHEDMHWLLLIIANTVVGEECEGGCHTAAEVYENSAALVNQQRGGAPFDDNAKATFLELCLNDPNFDRAPWEMQVDPFILLMGEVLSWAALENQMLLQGHNEVVSTELMRTTLLCTKRMLNAAGNKSEYESVPVEVLPLLPQSDTFSQLLVGFVLSKVFTCLSRFSGENKVCMDAVDLLNGIVESRASTIAASPDLYQHLRSLDIAKIPCRSRLMQALVFIGAAAQNAELQENMFAQIMQPLVERFVSLCALPSSTDVDSELTDLIQCFEGVAHCSENHSAPILLKLLNPIIMNCVGLLKSRAHAQPTVSAILSLMLNISTKVLFYVEDAEETMNVQKALLEMIDIYRKEQGAKFVGLSSDEDEKSNDLAIFIEILSNVMSKDILDTREGMANTGALVAVQSLSMLLSIMNEQVMCIPDVATRFFRLVLYLIDFSPEALVDADPQLIEALCNCLKIGLTSHFGMEVLSSCLEALAGLTIFMKATPKIVTPQVKEVMNNTLPLVFEACLDYSSENMLFNESCSCLFNFIQFDRPAFNAFVDHLINQKSNLATADLLRTAFLELVPPETPAQAAQEEDGINSVRFKVVTKFLRKERIQFRGRMETFLSKIPGLLSVY